MAADPTRVTLPLVFSANELARIRQGAGEQAPQAWARDTLLRFADDIQATIPAEPATAPAEPLPMPMPDDVAAILDRLDGLEGKLEALQAWLHVVYAEIRTQAVLGTATAKLGPLRRLMGRIRGRSGIEAAARERWAVGIGGEQLASMKRLIANGPQG
jgi:hypothetical protein